MADYDPNQDLPIYRRPIITPPMVDPSQIQATGTPISYTPPPTTPGQITPIPVNLQPSQSAKNIAAMTPPSINDPQYQAHGWHKALNAIAAGLAGFRNPQAGIATADYLKNYQYNRAMQDYQNKLALAKAQQGAEAQTFEQAIKPYQLGTTAENVQSQIARRANQSATDVGNLGVKQGTLAVKQGQAASTADYNKIKGDYLKWKEANPKLDDMQYLFGLPEDQQDTFKQMYKELHPAQMLTPAEKTAQQVQAKIDTEALPSNIPKESTVASAVSGSRAAASQTAQRESVIKKATDPKYLESKIKLDRASDDAKLTANEKQTVGYAREVMDRLPEVDSQLEQAEKEGDIANTIKTRWNDFKKGTLGQGAPQVFTQLATNLEFLQSKLAQIHTTRTSNEVLRKFEGMFNSSKMDYQTLKTSYGEVKKWLAEYAKDPRDVGNPTLDKNSDIRVNQKTGTKYTIDKKE